MEEDNGVITIKQKNMFVPITIVQALCVAVILIAVLIIKFGFASSFSKLQDFCKTNILEPTEITADFDGENQ